MFGWFQFGGVSLCRPVDERRSLVLVLIKLNCPYFFTLVWIHLSQATKAKTRHLISTHLQIQSKLKLSF